MRLLPAVLILAALIGCGGDDFIPRVTAAQNELDRSVAGWSAEVGRDVGSGDGPAAAAKLQATSRAMDRAADEFAAIDTPDELKHARDLMVDGLRKIAADLRGAASAARVGDFKRVDAVMNGYPHSAGVREIQRSIDELSVDD
jgi:hypothetical protein